MKKNNFSVVKLILFLIFFLIVLALFLIIYIIPVMKKYKTNEMELKKYEKLYKKQVSNITFLDKKRELLRKKYKNAIIKYEGEFNEKDFKNFLSQSIKDLKLELKNKKNGYYYKISGKIESIEEYNRVIDKINSYKNIVKINFPISLKKEDKLYFILFYVTIVNKKLIKNL